MYTEIVKIIEGGIKRDPHQVISYGTPLAKKLRKEGEVKLANKITKLIDRAQGLPEYKGAFFESPIDRDGQLNIANIIMPENIETEIVLSESVSGPIDNFISLEESRNLIISKGLDLRLSLLLYGPPGCGKTTLAKHIAKELDLPIVIARLDSLISSLLGSTGKNIRKLFDYAKARPCVLFLDESDAIAKERSDSNDLGEVKRVINSLLQNMDEFLETGILIAATNHESLLDKAIWRRFEKVVHVGLPSREENKDLLLNYFRKVDSDLRKDAKILEIFSAHFEGLSHSEIIKVLNNAYYDTIIQKSSFGFPEILTALFKYRMNNRFSSEDLIKFLNSSGVSQKSISKHLNLPLRQVRSMLNMD